MALRRTDMLKKYISVIKRVRSAEFSEFWASSAITLINVIVYAVLVMACRMPFLNVGFNDLLRYGAIQRWEVAHGEYWRLPFAIFLHGSVSHLYLCIIGLISVAFFIERLFGSVRFLLIYVVSGLIGNILGIALYNSGVFAGSSGAVFGLLGAMMALIFTDIIEVPAKRGLVILVVLFSVVAFFMMPTKISLLVHAVAMCCGFVMGFIFFALDMYNDVPFGKADDFDD